MAEKYFSDLNYSLANEDTRLELDLCKQYKPKSILSICGSGGRFLPLLAAGPKSITALDLAPQQLYVAELRQESILKLEHEDFLLFWGFAPYKPTENKGRRKIIFEQLDLSQPCRSYFQQLFDHYDWEGLIYKGKWEKTFTGVPKLLRKVVRDSYDHMFSFKTQAEQDAFMNEKLRDPLWKSVPRLVLLVFGNAAFFNAILYRGHFVKKNINGSYYNIYRNAFRRLFANGLARENFFLQLVFLGEIRFPEGNTIEARADVFSGQKAALEKKARINLVQANLLNHIRETQETYDFVSLSDIPSYFAGDDERRYMQDLKRCLNPGAIVVLRCYLRIPEGTDLSGYEDISAQHKDAIAAEKVQMYNTFIYKLKA